MQEIVPAEGAKGLERAPPRDVREPVVQADGERLLDGKAADTRSVTGSSPQCPSLQCPSDDAVGRLRLGQVLTAMAL